MTSVTIKEARISWTAPSKNTDGTAVTNLAGYRIYYGNAPRTYTQSVAITGASTTQQTLPLSSGTWYFAVTARKTDGSESAYSAEVTRTIN
jgi:hypothetical protein